MDEESFEITQDEVYVPLLLSFPEITESKFIYDPILFDNNWFRPEQRSPKIF